MKPRSFEYILDRIGMGEGTKRNFDEYLPDDLRRALSERALRGRTRAQPEDIRRAAIDFVQENHGDSLYSFLTGSHAAGTATAMSDVDIYVIYETLPNAVREQVLFRFYPLQMGVVSESYLWAIIKRDQRSGSLSFLPAFAGSEYLAGSAEAFAATKREAIRILAEGPPPAPSEKIARARAAVINNLLKLFRETDGVERFGACTKLVRSVAKYIQLCDQAWVMNEVRYELVLRGSGEYASTVEAVPEALIGNVRPLVSVVHAILKSRGPVNWSMADHDNMPFFN
mgnify:CR=1 FL=1